ncbi:MAG: DNA primase [Oscillospiraceae bacterium]
MALPSDFLDRLKAANPIAEVMGSYVNLKRTGRDYVCLCPFHNEKTPSCHIHPDQEYFYCFGCHAGGDVITFTMKYNNLDYWEAVKLLAERGGVPLPEDSYFKSSGGLDKRKRFYEMNKTAARFFYDRLRSNEGKACREYLVRRGLTAETVQKYGIGFAPNSWSELKNHMMSEGFTEQELIEGSLISRSQHNTKNTYDFFVNRAMFPFIDLRGNIVGFGGRALSADDKRKYLNSKDTAVYQKNRFLFSMNFAKNAAVKDRKIILCEGNVDVVTLNQAGFENAVASCGTALTPEQIKLISNYADEVLICYDSDEAGQKATSKAISLLNQAGLKSSVIKVADAKDPDEYINKFGAVKFRYLIDHANGAVNFELSKCKNGLDLSTNNGKVDYIKNASKVLMQIVSPVEREVYVSQVADEIGVDKKTVMLEVNNMISKRINADKKRGERELVNFSANRRDNINPEAAEHYKESKAEMGIIYYIWKNPDACNEIISRLPPEKFITSFNRRIYEFMTNKIINNEDCTISSFNSEFSPDEVGKITSIFESCRNIGIDSNVVNDYIDLLLNYKQKTKYDDMSDEEFLRNFKQLKKNKS